MPPFADNVVLTGQIVGMAHIAIHIPDRRAEGEATKVRTPKDSQMAHGINRIGTLDADHRSRHGVPSIRLRDLKRHIQGVGDAGARSRRAKSSLQIPSRNRKFLRCRMRLGTHPVPLRQLLPLRRLRQLQSNS